MPSMGCFHKRNRASNDDSLGKPEEPAAKRRFEIMASERRDSADNAVADPCMSFNVGPGLAATNEFSDFFDDELFTLESSTQSNSTLVGKEYESIDDLFDDTSSLEYDGLPSSTVTALAQQPPSSVLRGLDRGSRSAEEFDPTLQCSPPDSCATLALGGSREPTELASSSECSWSCIQDDNRQPKKPSELSKPGRDPITSTSHETDEACSPGIAGLSQNAAKQRDCRLVVPPDADKTFFHVVEMIEAKLQRFKGQPEAEFDWFARVLYSVRENFHQKQHFQFRDLFTENPPFLSGTLLG
ncbi:hypothetical protein HIM_09448 [Hirsutella minnesotensis 3608]|uniref:Uncharacterized protein n=1 Tax=Hirsutella minnesotensis 3608 TaxID=1043627 RepID=A0A0F8A337_9HYPO|nr:hypothetical protein HIM_09448 [Hirsutella minnesotensis 3608]